MNRKIFIIENDEDVRSYLEFFLGMIYDCKSSENYKEENFPEIKRADAILIDFSLPGQHGIELCHKLRTLGIDAPIILTSVHDDPWKSWTKNNLLDNGVTDIHNKTWPAITLLDKITYWVEEKRCCCH